MTNNFSKMLNKLLEGKSVTQVAKDIGVSKSLLSEWRSSKRGPNLSSLHHVKALADYLGVDFEELIFGEEKRESEVLTTVNFKDENKTYNITITRIKDKP